MRPLLFFFFGAGRGWSICLSWALAKPAALEGLCLGCRCDLLASALFGALGLSPWKPGSVLAFSIRQVTAEFRDVHLIFRSTMNFLIIFFLPFSHFFFWVKFIGVGHQPLQAACQWLPAQIRTNIALPLLAGEGNLFLLYLEDSHQGLIALGRNLTLQPENALQILLAGDWFFLVSLWMLKWCNNKRIRMGLLANDASFLNLQT